MDIVKELEQLLRTLQAENVPYALCDGFALAVYGITRATEDIDLLIEESSLPKIRELGERLGFRFDRQPLVFKGGGEDFLVLDLLLVSALTQPAWLARRAVETKWGVVHVVSPDGLIHLKSLRGSGQDEDDIRQLKQLGHES
jgi:hypothetical protein